MRPCAVSKPPKTLKSGAGRMPSAGALELRVAISTRASARRWAEVRAPSSVPARGAGRAFELVGHDGARNRVEGHLAQPQAREARLQKDVARGSALLFAGFGPVGVGQLLPIAQGSHEVLEAQVGGLGNQHLFVTRHGGLGAVTPRRGDGPGRILSEGTVAPGLG